MQPPALSVIFRVKVRARFDGDEARLVSGEFPLRPQPLSAPSCDTTSASVRGNSGYATSRRDHGDPRTRCTIALDVTVVSPSNTTEDGPNVVAVEGREGFGDAGSGVGVGVGGLACFSCFVHEVIDLVRGQGIKERQSEADSATALEGLRLLRRNFVQVLFKADTRRVLDIGDGSQLRIYNPCCLWREGLGGRVAHGPLLTCTQLCEPFPACLPPLPAVHR